MILKTAANYNDEGGYIEAWKNSDGTTEVKLIPKSGGDEGKNGILSVTISPAITTTPALDSQFPIYWEDLEPSQSNPEREFELNVDGYWETDVTYTATITPTAEMYVFNGSTFGGKGEPATITATADDNVLSVALAVADSDTLETVTKSIAVMINITRNHPET